MKKLAMFLILLTLTPLLMSTKGCDEPKSSTNNKTAEAEAECTTDNDCAAVKDDCCGCKAGGQQQAIAKSEAKAVEKKFAKECQDTMCIQMISNHESCKKKAHCINGLCGLE